MESYAFLFTQKYKPLKILFFYIIIGFGFRKVFVENEISQVVIFDISDFANAC